MRSIWDKVMFRLVVALGVWACLCTPTWAADKWGVVLMHGKNPGSASDPSIVRIAAQLESAGAVTIRPDMPWSRTRYIDKDLVGALAEIDMHIKTLREKGATRIALAGHSMGCPIGMAYAAQKGGVDALILMAPGHVPYYYFTAPSMSVVRDSIDLARAMVAKGEGDKVNTAFNDINQGSRKTIFTTPNIFLSYFDPDGDAEMAITAPRIPASTPVLWVVGKSDPMASAGPAYVFDRLPANPKSKYLEIDANHLSTPSVAAEAVVQWLTGL